MLVRLIREESTCMGICGFNCTDGRSILPRGVGFVIKVPFLADASRKCYERIEFFRFINCHAAFGMSI